MLTLFAALYKTRVIVTDVHEYVLHNKKINLGLCRMGCDTMLGQGCTGVTAPLQAMGQHWEGFGSMY